MKILVTGGTGHLGRVVVARLRQDGHQVRILRDTRATTASSSGLRAISQAVRASRLP